MQQLHGKVALITGSASGIGRAVAERFLAEGASVVGLDRGGGSLPESPDHLPLVGDVRVATDNRRAVDAAIERFGRLDIFVGNAGVYDNRRRFASFRPDELDAAFDELFAVDVKGCMLGAHAALDALKRSRGCILFTSSLSGSHAGFGGPLYVAAKHAINGLTKQLAWELAPDIRVNAVAPGYVPTHLRGAESLGGAPTSSPPTAADLPLQAFATPQDHAAAYVFLASDACARIATGTVLALDGGAALTGPRRS